MEEKFAEKLADLEETIRNTASKGGYVISFCREWVKAKPDPLYDFVVYRDQTRSYDLTKLLVGVPGPRNTPWEGGLFPMTMEWESGVVKPPRCRFPGRFHHPNVAPSGTICVRTLNEEEMWRPDMSIPEMMFSIQQILAHPDTRSPAQSAAYHCYMNSIEQYNAIAETHARKYQPDRFLEIAREAFRNPGGFPSILVNSPEQEPRERPRPPPIQVSNKDPVANRSCFCSCCAWGNTRGFWDSRLQMRFFFPGG